jgi:hypothetical protein
VVVVGSLLFYADYARLVIDQLKGWLEGKTMNNKEKNLTSSIAGWLSEEFEIDLEHYWNSKTEKVDWEELLKNLRVEDESASDSLAEMLEGEGIYS